MVIVWRTKCEVPGKEQQSTSNSVADNYLESISDLCGQAALISLSQAIMTKHCSSQVVITEHNRSQ